MSIDTLKSDNSKPGPELFKKASKLIDSGGLVIFPTETEYSIACRVQPDSMNILEKILDRPVEESGHWVLTIGPKTNIEEYLPKINYRTRKLIQNAWPGPVILDFELNDESVEIQKSKLHKNVFDALYKDNSIKIRFPGNPFAMELLGRTVYPVVTGSAMWEGKPARDGELTRKKFQGKVDLIIDTGAVEYQQGPTVVKIYDGKVKIVTQGVYEMEKLEKAAQVKILFVCTGNTCRSPIAEGLCKKYLAEKIGCGVDQLNEMGYKVDSVGIMGLPGYPASEEAKAACAAKGCDISQHTSKPLTEDNLTEADIIFAMTRVHLARINELSPQSADKSSLLLKNQDVPDPIGQSQQIYDICAEKIETGIKKRIDGILS